jgi:hypothetical protein
MIFIYSLRVTSYKFVEFGGHICEQIIGITMGENCAPLLADPFLCSCEAELLPKTKAKYRH